MTWGGGGGFVAAASPVSDAFATTLPHALELRLSSKLPLRDSFFEVASFATASPLQRRRPSLRDMPATPAAAPLLPSAVQSASHRPLRHVAASLSTVGEERDNLMSAATSLSGSVSRRRLHGAQIREFLGYPGDYLVLPRQTKSISRGLHQFRVSTCLEAPGVAASGVAQGDDGQESSNSSNQTDNTSLQESAGMENMCPEGRKECVDDCRRDDNNFKKEAACERRCIEYCNDGSDVNVCPEGKPECQKRCDDMNEGDDVKIAGCKARCLSSCCPGGRQTCLENCQQKAPIMIPSCEASCRKNCEKLVPDESPA
eukprot:TRINITY_DN33862_c0_g1_i1.p1 TRINITY_DN33862_c0_g1~~TRINITY_DN33862_c0_g1_i1.p1  ORF type:complete len:314 (-),score=52.03 TRINITY_DN33862_c0_g1_i1:190-1131(-)